MIRPLAVAAALVAAPAAAQSQPGTDIHVATLTVTDATFRLGPVRRLTERPGYDNQPAFAVDGRSVFYTSVRDGGPGGSTQADIFRVDLEGRRHEPVVATPESEYSPTPILRGREIAVIRVEADSTQRLWAFPVSGGGPPRLLLERLAPVGYQAWLDENTVGLYVLGQPATLRVADLRTGNSRILLGGIGRAVQRIPGRRALSVTQQVTADDWWIIEVDPETAATRPVAKMLAGAEYYVWLPNGDLLSARESSFYRLRPGPGAEWKAVATVAGVTGITRLVLSPTADRIAFVASEATP